jgi:hypothetical protein
MQDQVDNTNDRKNDLHSNIELADIRMTLLDLGRGLEHFIFFFFCHKSLLNVGFGCAKLFFNTAANLPDRYRS